MVAAAAVLSIGKDPREGKQQASGTHVYLQDERNANILIGIRDGVLDSFDLVWRPQVRGESEICVGWGRVRCVSDRGMLNTGWVLFNSNV